MAPLEISFSSTLDHTPRAASQNAVRAGSLESGTSHRPIAGSPLWSGVLALVILATSVCLVVPDARAEADDPTAAGAEEASGSGEGAAAAASGPVAQDFIVDSSIPTRKLSLDEALALAVQNNLDVEVARYSPQTAEQEMLAAWGAYDPTLTANIGYEKEEVRPTFLAFIVGQPKSRARTVNGGVGVSSLLPYVGATVGVELDTGRTQANSGANKFRPQYDSALFLTANVPLMQGLIWNRPWTDVKVRKIGHYRSLDDFRGEVMTIVESTINAYWTFVANGEQFGVARKSLETAEALLDQTKTQYDVGVVSKVEVVEAEAGVADREFNLIVARNDLEDSQDSLIDAVLGRELDAATNIRVEATDDPEDYTVRDVNVEAAVRTAFEKIPELASVKRSIEEREVEVKFAKNQRLPEFDIDARYGFSNASGEFGNIPPDGNLNTRGYADSYDKFFNDEGFETYSVRGTFSIPIPNRTASRNLERSRIDLRRAKSEQSRTQQRVILEVRSAARGILASARGIEAAERRRLAAEEQLRAERIRLEHGESTPFDVLQRESDLVEAESQKINALQAYRRADARLERAQGTILDSYRIDVDGVRDAPMR